MENETLGTLDEVALSRLRRLGGPALVARMVHSFLASAPLRLSAAREASERADLGGVEFAAHDLKTAAGNVGAGEVHLLSGRLERAAAEGNSREVETLLGALVSAFEPARNALRQVSA